MREITEEEKRNYIQWAEENQYLYELLCTCGENGIETFASCGGHEEDDSSPYLGIIINDNSMPFMRGILAQLQDMSNISIRTGVRGGGVDHMLPDETLRAVAFYARNHNCCEMFYKMKKGIECKDREVKLHPNFQKLYENMKRLHTTSREQLKADMAKHGAVGSGILSTDTPEYKEYQNQKKLRNTKKNTLFFQKLFPFYQADSRKKGSHSMEDTRFEELKKKYEILPREYVPDSEAMVEKIREELLRSNEDSRSEYEGRKEHQDKKKHENGKERSSGEEAKKAKNQDDLEK